MSTSNSKLCQVNRKSRFARARIAALSASAVASMYGSFANRAMATTTNNPIAGITGWNQDLVAENPLSTSTTAGFDTANGEDYFISGLVTKGINSATYGSGLPLNNMLVSAAAGTSTTFQFQSYTADNALLLTPLIASTNSSGIAPSTATLSLATPTATSSLAFLMASTNGAQTINYTLNYADGSTATGSFSAPDWFNNSPFAAVGLGRTTARVINSTQAIGIDTGQSNSSSGNPRLYEYDVPASVFNGSTGKYLSSISFTSPTTNSNATGIYAISGVTGATLAANPLTWTGLNGNNWDTSSSTNFNSMSGPSSFTQGTGPVTFDDTANAAQLDSNGNLTISIQSSGVSPAGLVFNNSYGNPSSIGYILTGGPVFGPTGLTVTNSGSVYLQNANTYIGATNVSNGGFLQIGATGSISSQNIIVGVGSTLAVTPGGSLAGNSGLIDNGFVALAATAQTLGYLSGTGELNLSGGANITIGGQLGYNTSFSGLISGSGNLIFRAPLSILGANTFVGTSTFGLNAAVLLGNPLSLGNASNTMIIAGSTSLEKMGGIGAAVPLTASTGGAVPYNVSFSGTNYFGFSGTNPLELAGNFTNWNTSGVTFNMIALPTAPLILDGKIGVGGGGLTVIGGGTTDGGGTFLGGLLVLNNSSGTNALTGTITIGGTGNGGALELIGANETGAVTAINVSASGANAALPATLIVSDSTGAAGYVGGNTSGARITTTIYGLGASLAVPNSATGVITPASFGALRGADGQNTIWAGNVSVGATAGISGGINGSLTLTGIISGSSQIQFSGNNNSNTVLANAETYTGETAISGYQGKLTLGFANAISKSSDLNLDTSANGSQGTTFDLAGYNELIGYLTTTSALPATANDKITNSGTTLSTLTLNGSGGTFSGSIQETATGPIAIYLNTTGTQTFNAASNYSGGTTMNGSGTLLAGNSLAFGSGALTLNNGYLGSSNASGVTISNQINYNAATGIQLNIANPINIPQNINIASGTILPFKTTGTDPTGKDGTFSGVISGAGTVNIIGTVAFTGLNTYSGGTNLTSGSLAIPSDNGHLGTGPLNFLGGALTFESYTSYLSFSNASGSTIPVTLGAASGAPSTLAGNISGGAGFNFVGPGILILAGSNTYTGPTTISGGELSYQSGFPLGTLTLNGGGVQYPMGVTTDLTTGGHTLVLGTGGGTIDTNGNNINFAGTIINSSTGSLTKTGAGTLTVSSPLALTNFYVRGGTSGGPSIFALNGSTNTLTASGTVGIGEASGDNAFITVNNGGKLTAGTLSVADAVATGTALPYNDGSLNIADTGNLGTAVTTATFYLGYANGGTNGLGVVNQSAGTFKSTGTSYIGYNGTGLYNMTGGTTNFSSEYLGYGTTGVGAINQSAGTINNSGGLYLGYNGAGTINLTGGLWNETNTTYLGYLSHTNVINVAGGAFNTSSTFYEDLDGGVGILNVSSGSFTSTGGSSFYMSDFEPGNNQVNVTGGSFNVSGSMYVGYYSSSGSVNSLNISGGTAVVGGTLYLGYGESYSVGNLYLTGTSLRVGAITSNTGIGSAVFNGATLVANSSSTSFISALSSATIGAGGLTINTNGYNDTVSQALLTGVTGGPDGGLTKTGIGTLTLSGVNTYTGPTNINLGGVIASGTQPFGAPGNVVNINPGGMIGISNDSQIALYTNGTTTLPYTFNYNGGGYEFLNYNSSLNIVTPRTSHWARQPATRRRLWETSPAPAWSPMLAPVR